MNNQHEKELEHINNELSKNNNPWQAEINNLFTLTLDEKRNILVLYYHQLDLLLKIFH